MIRWPHTLWRAQNLIFLFRAVPEWTVSYLRQELETQLGDELMPRDYVFLKSVGRCLARVRIQLLLLERKIPRQENIEHCAIYIHSSI